MVRDPFYATIQKAVAMPPDFSKTPAWLGVSQIMLFVAKSITGPLD
jgi:hypothetical protein